MAFTHTFIGVVLCHILIELYFADFVAVEFSTESLLFA
jgi:hypothetical protein